MRIPALSLMCIMLLEYLNKQLFLLLLLLKKVSSARLGESDIHPISPKTTAPQYQPIDRKKRKGKRVEDYSRDDRLPIWKTGISINLRGIAISTEYI